jgi:cell volume regulation protein A
MLEHFETDYLILLLSLLLLLGVITTKFSTKIGVPALVLFIGLGMVMGSDGLNIIYFSDVKIAQVIGIIALVIILFEGGLKTKWSSVKKVAAPSLSLATIGVLITTSITALGAKVIFDMDWLESFLIGAIVGSTDAAAVFAILAGQNVKGKLTSILEAESGTNDPMAMFLTISTIQLITSDYSNIVMLILSFFWEMSIGLLLGYGLGWLASKSINKINLEFSGLYPVFTLVFAILSYSVTSMLHASGLFAVYVTALVIGNKDLTYRNSILRFHAGVAWLMQILMFIILGLLVFPSQLFDLDLMWKALLLSVILIVIARPAAVYAALSYFPFSSKEFLFISWAGLRGAVPIVLATFPFIDGVENSHVIFHIVFFVVLTSALVQGSTIPLVAKSLGLTEPEKDISPNLLEVISLGKVNAELIEYAVSQKCSLLNKQVKDITFPEKVWVNALIRNKDLLPARDDLTIKNGDILYILADKKSIPDLKELLNIE